MKKEGTSNRYKITVKNADNGEICEEEIIRL